MKNIIGKSKIIVLTAILTLGLFSTSCGNGTSSASNIQAPASQAPAPAVGSCPSNYVKIGANSSYSLSDFCISKYEMKVSQNDGLPVFDGFNGGVALNVTLYKPDSRPNGIPWVKILYSDAIAECAGLGTGYHLSTIEEWQVVAREVENVGENWSGGVAGSGTLYSGHTDGAIAGTAIADGDAVTGTSLLSARDGANPYVGTGQNSSQAWASGKEQKRTYILANGEEIWDLSGNSRELVDIDGMGGTLNYTGPGGANFFELGNVAFTNMIATAVSSNAVSLSSDLFQPSNTSWIHATSKIGKVYLNANAQVSRVVTRGGNFSSGNFPGIYAADFDQTSGASSSTGGYRCVAPLQ